MSKMVGDLKRKRCEGQCNGACASCKAASLVKQTQEAFAKLIQTVPKLRDQASWYQWIKDCAQEAIWKKVNDQSQATASESASESDGGEEESALEEDEEEEDSEEVESSDGPDSP